MKYQVKFKTRERQLRLMYKGSRFTGDVFISGSASQKKQPCLFIYFNNYYGGRGYYLINRHNMNTYTKIVFDDDKLIIQIGVDSEHPEYAMLFYDEYDYQHAKTLMEPAHDYYNYCNNLPQ